MNKIDELRNYADNLKIKLEVKNDTIKRYKFMVDKLKAENKYLKKRINQIQVDDAIEIDKLNKIIEMFKGEIDG